MRQFIITLMIPLSGTSLFAHDCKVQYTETVDSTCKIFGTVEQADVTYNQEAKEFHFTLAVTEMTHLTRRYFNCWGRQVRVERDSKSQAQNLLFKQVEEGHADFTLAREVNQYIKDHKNEACP